MSQDVLKDLKQTQKASLQLLALSEEKINGILDKLAKETIAKKAYLLEENQKDLDKMDKENPKYDRLKLTDKRLDEIADAIEAIALLQSPINEIIEEKTLKNSLQLKKIRVPLGVIGIIFEARPNVFFDCFALCFKTKNASVLKGSRDAYHSNKAIFTLIQKVLKENGIAKDIICFLEPERENTEIMLKAHSLVDVIIPRGSSFLIDFVRENAKIPVIETGAGIVHTFIDNSADLKKAAEIVFNAKTQRVSVCNALDCLIIEEGSLDDLYEIVKRLAEKDVTIFADGRSFEVLQNLYPENLLKQADESSFGTEFLDFKLSVKTVSDIDEAIEHISKYSSRHSEAIISENRENIEKFQLMVDAACVYANASTRFTDGGVFELGAEIGISTQKLHGRGPMGLREITSYKWVIDGEGQVRG